MVKRILKNKKKTITAVLITLLLLTLLIPILILARYLPKSYPNSEPVSNQTDTSAATNHRVIILSSINTTSDSREIVTDWYDQNGQYGLATSNEVFDGLGWSTSPFIPGIGKVEMEDHVMIYKCPGKTTTCIFHKSWFQIRFDGFLGEGLEKLLNKI